MAPHPSAGQENTPSEVGSALATQRTDAAKVIWVRVLKEQVAALEKEVRPLVEEALEPGEQVTAVMPDGTRVGKVSRSEVPEVVVFTDYDALVRWVQDNRPDEIVPTIRESYLNNLKDQVKKHGYAHTPDGEVIPGIELGVGTPRFVPTPNDAGRDLVLSWLSGITSETGMLALPPAEAA